MNCGSLHLLISLTLVISEQTEVIRLEHNIKRPMLFQYINHDTFLNYICYHNTHKQHSKTLNHSVKQSECNKLISQHVRNLLKSINLRTNVHCLALGNIDKLKIKHRTQN